MLSRISKSESGMASTVAASTVATNNGTSGTGNTAWPAFYLVRKSWDKPKTQIAAFTKIESAQNCVDCNPGYAAFDEAGNQVYPHSPDKPNKL